MYQTNMLDTWNVIQLYVEYKKDQTRKCYLSTEVRWILFLVISAYRYIYLLYIYLI